MSFPEVVACGRAFTPVQTVYLFVSLLGLVKLKGYVAVFGASCSDPATCFQPQPLSSARCSS